MLNSFVVDDLHFYDDEYDYSFVRLLNLLNPEFRIMGGSTGALFQMSFGEGMMMMMLMMIIIMNMSNTYKHFCARKK